MNQLLQKLLKNMRLVAFGVFLLVATTISGIPFSEEKGSPIVEISTGKIQGQSIILQFRPHFCRKSGCAEFFQVSGCAFFSSSV